jgi:hypothetical protein
MTTKREYRSEALGAIHETMAALENIGAISKITMREFDEACLQPVQELKPEEIRALREREHLQESCIRLGAREKETRRPSPEAAHRDRKTRDWHCCLAGRRLAGLPGRPHLFFDLRPLF